MTHNHGVSGISIQGDVEAGQQYVPRAKRLLSRLADRIHFGGVKTASDFVRLDDHAYCYGVVAHGIQRAVIVVDTATTSTSTTAASAFVTVPDFYSGDVVDGSIHTPPKDYRGLQPPDYIADFWPTPDCARLFKLPAGEQRTPKLAVKPYGEFAAELDAPEGVTTRYSQYVQLKPTMYSGRMREVVQFLMGLGHQGKSSLYDRTPGATNGTRQPPSTYEQEVAATGAQIRYDWRWYRTHGIGVGADGKLWLVEIGNTRGALAMLLPMNAVSQTAAFRQKLTKLNDTAGLFVLDAFGGFPTGESFPAQALDSWIRAGRVVRLSSVADLQPFYDLSAFSSGMGWAFNHSGNEAHNTAHGLGADHIHFSSHYSYSFTLGAVTPVSRPHSAAAAKRAIRSKSNDARFGAVIYKIDRMPERDLSFLLAANAGFPADLFEALDAYSAAPQAVCSGHTWREASGPLYKPGKKAQYNLKHPWPELGYLVSFDMQAPAFVKPVLCDTDVHVFYVGNQLKIVRWFFDPRSIPAATVSDDSDGCELAGSFTRTTEFGRRGLPPMVYSLDYDDRRELLGGLDVVHTEGVDLGYFRVRTNDDLIHIWLATLTRTKRFRRTVNHEVWSGQGVDASMVVPFHDRCAYYYCVKTSEQSYGQQINVTYPTQSDPWYCNTWRNFPGLTGPVIGGVFHRAQHPDGCGPVDARTVASPSPNYAPETCSEFADAGEWCFICDNADAMVYEIPEPPTPPVVSTASGFRLTRRSFLVNASAQTPLLIAEEVFTDPFGGYDFPWFTESPDPDSGETQYADVTHNVLGDGDALRFWSRPNGVVMGRGGLAAPTFPHGAATFIGVVP